MGFIGWLLTIVGKFINASGIGKHLVNKIGEPKEAVIVGDEKTVDEVNNSINETLDNN